MVVRELGNLLLHAGLRRARQHVGDDRHLPLPRDAADRRRRRRRARSVAMLSSVTLPSRDDGTVSAAIAVLGRAILLARAQVHFVLLTAVVERRHRVAADEQPQRFGRVADRDAEVGRLRPIDVHRQLRLAEVERRVDVDQPGNRPPPSSRSASL